MANDKVNFFMSRDVWAIAGGLATIALVFFATVNLVVNPIGKKIDTLASEVRSEFKEVRRDIASFKADVRERLKGVETKLDYLQQ